ncbi:ribosome small subunit-dependent GTPase A [Pseudoalteromonas sp. T1lg23B]|uniref:ribosome small subunit-dependent GTPase A n=1 Tax=Pseudoalteromonas sp. T1lg23B TaxID=2077097 RepID=UPI000CF700C7|nr:ribosome small subunit-dependent GTPase A [Pseudoalteromonas sp. T1lg23B]
MNQSYSLRQLGWQPFFQQQLSLDEYEHTVCGRITEHHRSEYIVQLETQSKALAISQNLPNMVVGDWVLLDQNLQFVRLLQRKSLFSRKSAGAALKQQMIAANVDTLFIVMSLNQDFNLNRLERYLALAHDADVEPVVVLSKRDLCDDVESKVAQVQALNPLLMVVALNGLLTQAAELLAPWCGNGKTVSFVGSSGVGKSTLINRLLGEEVSQTNGIREDDDKGKHTTTARCLYISEQNGAVMDTPGMRELQLAGSEQSLQTTFADIEEFAQHCRFKDCHHQNEPSCAVLKALEQGELDARRLVNYQKLLKEQAHNNASLKQQRDKDKQFGKFVKQALKERKLHKGW